MLENSGLWDQQHLELVEGEVINKMGKRMPHGNCLMDILMRLLRIFGEQYVISETTINVAPEDNPTSEPEPDLVVLNSPRREIQTNPRPADLRLVVEVSDSTLQFDLTVKAGLYARAGIPDYWVFDIAGRRLVVHRDPSDGAFRSIQAYSEQESVSPLAAPDQQFRIAEAFGG